GGFLRRAQKLDRGHRQRQHLLVAGPSLHHLDALVEIPQHRDVHPALERRSEAGIALGDALHPLEVLERKDVRKDVQFSFGHSSFTPAMVASSRQRAASARITRPKASPASGSVTSCPMSITRFLNSAACATTGTS